MTVGAQILDVSLKCRYMMMDHTCIMKYNTHISNVVVVFGFWEESSTITNTPKLIGIPLQRKT